MNITDDKRIVMKKQNYQNVLSIEAGFGIHP